MTSTSTKWIVAVCILVLVAGAVWYFLSRSPAVSPPGAPESFGGEIGGRLQNPGAAVPETNPFETKTNPFEGGYLNPFSR